MPNASYIARELETTCGLAQCPKPQARYLGEGGVRRQTQGTATFFTSSLKILLAFEGGSRTQLNYSQPIIPGIEQADNSVASKSTTTTRIGRPK